MTAMSSAYIKKYERKYHDEKQAPAPDHVRYPSPHKKPKPFTIEAKWHNPWGFDKDWYVAGRYTNKAGRDQAFAKFKREEEERRARYPNSTIYTEYRIPDT